MADPKTKAFTSQDQRIQAVYARDPEARSAFIYAVKTTGIYCRPDCPSRRPKQKNIVLFDTSADAEKAGYRPCRRCAPNIPTLSNVDERIITACRIIEKSEDCPPLAGLAQRVGLSPFHFHRIFKQTMGLTPKQYADAVRMQRLQGGLHEGLPITQALYAAGFGSSSRMYEKSDQLLGMTPGQYQDRGRGAAIRYSLTQTSLGWLVVASTEKGICAIAMGDSPQELIDGLQKRFSRADIIQANDQLFDLVKRISEFLDSPRQGLDLPLDIQGTSFQRRVWAALQELKPGETATYSQIAKRLGMPRSPRAVARAIASNPIALAVPCHRVVRKDGGLGGYRWGIERKAKLLKRESQITGASGSNLDL